MTDVLTPAKIAARLAGTGVRTILLSTSAVLDCKEPGMSAERPRAPASLYGQFKAEAEEAKARAEAEAEAFLAQDEIDRRGAGMPEPVDPFDDSIPF